MASISHTSFADRLTSSISTKQSCLCAGIDPRVNTIPACFFDEADLGSEHGALEHACAAIERFYVEALQEIAPHVACVKPNIAFFEALGIRGLQALRRINEAATARGLLIILDAKRGDIGSTAQAYAQSYFDGVSVGESHTQFLNVDSLTVNPFLGFDTLEPFAESCASLGRGLFVLVKTSNGGSDDLQGLTLESGLTVAEHLAAKVSAFGEAHRGPESGYSSIGAVVGATYPEEARRMRELMPYAYFLIPGLGAQGGSAADAVAGFDAKGGGGVVNASRGIFSMFSSLDISKSKAFEELISKTRGFQDALNQALS